MKNAVDFSIETQMTAMEIYPHRGTLFHIFMGIITILGIVPLSILVFPVLLILNLIIHTILFALYRILGKKPAFKRLWSKKNHLLLGFHYIIYKVFYIYTTIWWNSTPLANFDDYWYGLKLSPYFDYNDYVSSYRNSRVRWKFKKKLKSYAGAGIDKECIDDDNAFFKILFSTKILKLILQSSFRKNNEFPLFVAVYIAVRDFYLLLFLPVRVHTYKHNNKVIGLASYLMRGNTLIMCQHIIADSHTRSGLFYEQMNDLLKYAFNDKCIRYVSCSITTGQAKQTCGLYPVNYLMTDEFEFKPFIRIKSIGK